MSKDSYMKVSVDYAIQWDEAVNRLDNTQWELRQKHDMSMFDDLYTFMMKGVRVYPVKIKSHKAVSSAEADCIYASLSTGIGKYTLEDIENEIKRLESFEVEPVKETTKKSWWEFWK